MKRFSTLLIALAVAISANASSFEVSSSEKGSVKPKKEYKYGKKGYFGNASFTFSDFGAFLDGEGWLIDKPHYGVDVINGYSFNPYLDLGVGLGAHRASPYLALKTGWAGVVYREKDGDYVGKFNQWGGSTYTNFEAGALVRFKGGKSLNVGVGMPWYFIPLLATRISVNVGFTW